MPRLRIDQRYRTGAWIELRQHGLKLARRNGMIGVIVLDLSKAVAVTHRNRQRAAVVEAHVALRRQHELRPVAPESPLSDGAGVAGEEMTGNCGRSGPQAFAAGHGGRNSWAPRRS